MGTRCTGSFPRSVLFLSGITLIVLGCIPSPEEERAASDASLFALSWSVPTTGIDTGTGSAVTPQIAVEPDPGNNGGSDDASSSAIAVWIEFNDIDPSDQKPGIYHIYAKRGVAGTWDTADPGCPFGFPNDILNDGVCLIDNGSLHNHATHPRIAMDSVGNAVVVWQEFVVDDVTISNPPRSRIYARRYVMGTGWAVGTDSLDGDGGVLGTAFAPDIAIEPDGGGTAIAIYYQYVGAQNRLNANHLTGGIGGGSWSGNRFVWAGPGSNPRIAMDNAGSATAAWIQYVGVPCDQSGALTDGAPAPLGDDGAGVFDGNTGPVISITCQASRIYASRFVAPGPLWSVAPFDLTPVQNVIDPGAAINENCEDYGNAFGIREELTTFSSACLHASDPQVTMDSTVQALGGNAFVAFKIHERAVLTNREAGGFGGGFQPTLDDVDAHERIAIFVRRYNGAVGTWDSATTGISDYEYSPGVDGSLVSDCGFLNNSDSTEDFLFAMNCGFREITLAISPGSGARAMVAYERYDGTRHDIVVHRYNGAAFGTVADADNCANTLATCWHNVDFGTEDAVAPSLAMDNNGNAILVWVQDDGTGRWRVYANRCAENGGDCTWSGPAAIDSGIIGENYFEPHAGMEAFNAGNSAANCGTGGVSCGDVFTVYDVLTSIFNFRIDAAQWSPP